MKRRAFQLGGLAVTALGLIGCSHRGEWKRKLTVTVKTPSGEVSGFAVQWEEIGNKNAGLGDWWVVPDARGAYHNLKGEAVVVEVSKGRYLFMLIQEGKPFTTEYFFPGKPPLDIVSKMAGRTGEVITVLPEIQNSNDTPMFVTFGNIKDPKTVREVDPKSLSGVFGSGYSLKSVTLEITDETVTEGVVENVLGWLGPHPEPGLCPSAGLSDNSKIPFCRKVNHGDFIRRII